MRELYRWSLTHPAASIAALVGCFTLFQVHAFYAIIRFSYPRVNYLIFLAAFVLPWIGLRYAFALGRWWKSAITIGLVSPFLVYSFIGAAFFILIPTSSDRLIAQIKMDGYRVRVTQIDGGTLGGEAVFVRQERTIFPGILIVRDIDRFLDTDKANCRAVAPDTVRVDVTTYREGADHIYRESGSNIKTYHLKPFLYF